MLKKIFWKSLFPVVYILILTGLSALFCYATFGIIDSPKANHTKHCE